MTYVLNEYISTDPTHRNTLQQSNRATIVVYTLGVTLEYIPIHSIYYQFAMWTDNLIIY